LKIGLAKDVFWLRRDYPLMINLWGHSIDHYVKLLERLPQDL
jgi:hypothetical protein